MPDDQTNQQSSAIPQEPVLVRGRFAAVVIAVLGILGSVVLVIAAIVTAEIDIDDLFDSLEPARIPALLLIAVTVVASLFLAGRRWARWVLAAELAAGSAWIILGSEIPGTWLRVALAVALMWGLSAIALVVSRNVSRYVETMADHWMVGYKRLLGALRSDDDARRWLSTLDTWDDSGVLTRGERKRVARALVSWAEETGPHADDVQARILDLSSVMNDQGMLFRLRHAVGKRN